MVESIGAHPPYGILIYDLLEISMWILYRESKINVFSVTPEKPRWFSLCDGGSFCVMVIPFVSCWFFLCHGGYFCMKLEADEERFFFCQIYEHLLTLLIRKYSSTFYIATHSTISYIFIVL